MAVHNRSFGGSEQRHQLEFSRFNMGLNIGETGVLAFVPYASVLEAAQIVGFNVSGSPFMQLNVQRFIVGSGVTTIAIGSTFVVPDFGVSGVLGSGVSLPASGSAALILMKNDCIGYIVGGSGTTVGINSGVAGAIVIRAVQDIRTSLFTD